MTENLATFLFAQSGAAGSPVAIQSVWDFVVKGGPMMIPIILCSLFAVSVFVERVIVLKKRSVIPPDFLDGLHAIMRDAKRTRKAALEYCVASTSPLGGILEAGIKRLNEPVAVLEKHVQDAGERAVALMRKNLRVLTVVASVCPLMGLLGTIFGMIEAFQTVAASGEALGKTELLAEGIYQAMITTAAGLLVAIPVVIGYHYLSARIESLVAEMDRMTLAFLEEHAYAPKPGDRAPTNGDVAGVHESGNAEGATAPGVREAAVGASSGMGG